MVYGDSLTRCANVSPLTEPLIDVPARSYAKILLGPFPRVFFFGKEPRYNRSIRAQNLPPIG
jgi:hypothetical protein